MKTHISVALGVFVVIAWSLPVRAQVQSTFDADLEGWRVVGDGAPTWSGTGGNPGGALSVNDQVGGNVALGVAPGPFLGDWSAFGANEQLSFDVFFSNTSGGTTNIPAWTFRLSGPGGRAVGLSPGTLPAENFWTTYQIALDPGEWTMQSGTWVALLANVTSLELYLEYVTGAEVVRLDNVSLTGTPGEPVFTPCEFSTFSDGTVESWSSSGTGGVTNPGGDGNSGGYLRVAEGGGNAYLYAPARFLGDWSLYDDAGTLSVDVRIIGRSGTNVGSPDFVALTGPGGSARVELVPDDLPAGGGIWKSFAFRLREADWILDSGSWSGLLADVTEFRIDAEYFTSTEVVGIDNIGRQLDTCDPIDAPVIVHDSGVVLCETYGFVNAYSAAASPLDGEIYGLSRASASAGGGFYAVTGPQSGVRIVTFGNPAQVVFDDDGDAFVSLDSEGTIQRVDPAGLSGTWVSGFHAGDDDVFAMAFAPVGFNGMNVSEGDIVVTDTGFGGPDEIWSFSPDFAEGEMRVTSDPGNVDWFGISDGPNGTMWVTDALAPGVIYELGSDGSLTPFPVALGSMRGLRYTERENGFYVFDATTQSIHRLEPGTFTPTLVANGFSGVSSTGISISQDETRLLVVDNVADRVYVFCLPVATTVAEPHAPRPRTLSSPQVHPNPLNPSTTIAYEMSARQERRLTIYSIAGRLVRTLEPWAMAEVGEHVVTWDGRDGQGRVVATGVYLVRLETATASSSRKVAVIK